MRKQKITLKNGVVSFERTKPLQQGHTARLTPAVRLSRLHQLLKTQKPKICLVRGEGLGDVLMATPTVHALKKMFPSSEITFATNTRYLNGALVQALQYNPDIDHIIERNLMEDIVFDLTINLHCPALVHEKPQTIPPNRIDIFAKHTGVKLDDPVPRYFPQSEEVEIASDFMQKFTSQDKVVMVQINASSQRRNIPAEVLKKTLTQLHQREGIKSLIIAHSTDYSTDVLWDNIPGSILHKDPDLRMIAALMMHSNLVLCPDSAFLHLSGALGVPAVGVFGPTHPQSRINHYQNTVAIWEGKDIPACCCWYENCPTQFACMTRITPELITEKCVQQIDRTSKVNINKILENNRSIEIKTEII